jgi:hypothetical protein
MEQDEFELRDYRENDALIAEGNLPEMRAELILAAQRGHSVFIRDRITGAVSFGGHRFHRDGSVVDAVEVAHVD